MKKAANAITIIAGFATIVTFCIQCPSSQTMSVFTIVKGFIQKHGMVLFWLCVLLLIILVILINRLYSVTRKNNITGTNKKGENVSLNVENVYVHHQTLKTWDLIQEAKHYIILNAAFYPKYGLDTDYSRAFQQALKFSPDLQVYVVITNHKTKWAGEFARVLRSEYDDVGKFKEGIDASISFFKNLKKTYPGRVHIKRSSHLPLAPCVIIDNTLLVGHYAHSETNAPNGYWLKIEAEVILTSILKLRNKVNYLSDLTDEEKALMRYVEDALFVFDNAEDVI